jgi:hypothetical protein
VTRPPEWAAYWQGLYAAQVRAQPRRQRFHRVSTRAKAPLILPGPSMTSRWISTLAGRMGPRRQPHGRT